MKYFNLSSIIGKKGKPLMILLFILLVIVIGISVYFRFPIVEGAVGSSSDTKSSGLSPPSTITNIKDVLNLPGVGKNTMPSNVSENWSMVNEIVEPDGTVVQDIVNTDGTVLTITNKQNVINSGSGSGSGSSSGSSSGSGSGSNTNNISTYNRNTF